MAAVTRGTSDLTQIQVNWIASTGDATGGSAIDSYELEYDDGTTASGSATWTALQGATGSYSTLTTYTLSSPTAGTWYRFRVRAHNVHGWSTHSAETAIQAADVPS